MKNTRWTLLAALVLAAPSLAHAQDTSRGVPGVTSGSSSGSSGVGGSSSMGSSGVGGSSGSMTGGSTAGGDSGAITNGASMQSTTTTSTTTEGIGPDGLAVADEGTTALPGTGGEPIVMSLLGLSMMVGAFAVRRRISA